MWTQQTATIANGASLSGAVTIQNGFEIVGIQMPAAWTAAGLSFQAAPTETGTYADVYDTAGNELTFSASTSRVIAVSPSGDGLRFRHIKVRSGTTSVAVNQAAERTITLLLRRTFG